MFDRKLVIIILNNACNYTSIVAYGMAQAEKLAWVPPDVRERQKESRSSDKNKAKAQEVKFIEKFTNMHGQD